MHKACSNVCLTQFWVFLLAHLTCVKRWLSALGLPDWLAQKIIACYVSASSKNYTIKMPSLEIFMCSPFLAGFVKWCYINNVLGKQLDAASIWRYRTVIGWAWWFNGYFFAMRYRPGDMLAHARTLDNGPIVLHTRSISSWPPFHWFHSMACQCFHFPSSHFNQAGKK